MEKANKYNQNVKMYQRKETKKRREEMFEKGMD